MDFVEAGEAKKPIKRMLLGHGGRARIFVEDKMRLLVHDASLRPLHALPWPLNLFQPHSVRFMIFEQEKAVEEKTFTRYQVNKAISLFLDGVRPDDVIMLIPDQRSRWFGLELAVMVVDECFKLTNRRSMRNGAGVVATYLLLGKVKQYSAAHLGLMPFTYKGHTIVAATSRSQTADNYIAVAYITWK